MDYYQLGFDDFFKGCYRHLKKYEDADAYDLGWEDASFASYLESSYYYEF